MATVIPADSIAHGEALSSFGYTFVDFGQFGNGLCVPLVGTFGYLCFEGEGVDIITDWCDRIPDRVLEQYEDKLELIDFICILIDEMQELEFVFSDLATLRSLDTSTGAQLDGVGDLLNLPRNGLDDDDYRSALKTQIAIYQSNGEPETLISILSQLTNASSVQLIEISPARVILFSDGFTIPANLQEQMEAVAPAGVALDITISSGVPHPDVFTLAPDLGTPDIGGKGFSEPTVPNSGGVLTEKI